MPRTRATVVVLRIGTMMAAQLGIGWLHRSTLGEAGAGASGEGLSVFRTVYTQCILILVTLFYYFGWKICSVTPPCGAGSSLARRRTSNSPDSAAALDMVGTTGSRLTIRNVWTFVFGMGLVLFIVSYSFVGLNSVCLVSLGIALGILALDELAFPRREMPASYILARSCSLACVILGLLLVAPRFLQIALNDFVFQPDVYSILFGLALPLLSQLTLSVVRDSAAYKLRGVLEMCEFGFPFTAFLGVFHLCVAYGQRQQEDSEALTAFMALSNHTATSVYFDFRYWYHFNDSMINTVVSTDGPFMLFYLLTPLVYVPACVSFVWCVLDGCAVDPLFSLVAVLCLEYPGGSPLTGWEISATVFCWAGVCARVVCEYRPRILMTRPPIYSMQDGPTQLPHYVGWTRGPTMGECEAETEELSHDFPMEGAGSSELIRA